MLGDTDADDAYDETQTAVAENVKPCALTGDLLDDLNLNRVGDAVAEDFQLYAFNCIAEKSVPHFNIVLPDEEGIPSVFLSELMADIHGVVALANLMSRVLSVQARQMQELPVRTCR